MPKFNLNEPLITTAPTVLVEDLPPGRHRFSLIVEDEAGNRSAPSEAFVTVASPLPVVSATIPGFGAWGTQVRIAGRNFDPTPAKNRVTFNGVLANVEAATPEQLTVRVPQPATTGTVTVQTSNGEASTAEPFIIPVLTTIGLGTQPFDLDLDELKNELWIAGGNTQGAGEVLVLSLADQRVTDRIRVEGVPSRIAITAGRERRLCVTISPTARNATLINLGTRLVTAVIALRATPSGLAISPDGRWAYVTAPADTTRTGSVSVIDLDVAKLITTIPVEPAATETVFAPNGKEAFVNNLKQALVTVIEVATHKVTDIVKIGGADEFSVPAIAPTTETYPCWTANNNAKTAAAINANHAVETIALPLAATVALAARNSKLVFFANAEEKLLALVSAGRLQPFEVTPLKLSAPALAEKSLGVTPDETGLFVVHPRTNQISFFELGRKISLRCEVPVAELPTRGLITNDNRFVCVINQRKEALTLVERASVLP